MSTCLIVSKSDKSVEALSDVLKETGFLGTEVVKDSQQAKIKLQTTEYDLVVVNTPLFDKNGLEFCIYTANTFDCSILMLVKAEIADEIQKKVQDYGIFVISKPLGRQLFQFALKIILVSRKKILYLKQNENRLIRKLEDTKVIERAKCCLIERLSFTEQQAHKYVEKRAMDARKTKRQVSEDILKTYEM